MNKEQIKKAIREHSSMSYYEAKLQAKQALVNMDDFDRAWSEIQSEERESHQNRFSNVYFVILALLAGVELGALVLKPELVLQYQQVIFLGSLAAGIILFHFSTKILGLRSALFKSTIFSLLFYVLTGIVQAVQETLLFVPILVIFVALIFFIFMKAYRVGFVRSIFLIMLIAFLTVGHSFIIEKLINAAA